jgi:plasmid stabilization system protein ParE
MTIVVAPKAQDDLRQAYEYIGQDNPRVADQVLVRITEVIGLLASGAVKGKEVVLKDGRRVNTWPVPPYRIYYRLVGEAFHVVRVYHQARQPIEQER